ncbi:OpgC domain-containing protein [Arthrobacter sp. Y81]|uniref:OpgC domain-containing protein n=1 Tax=Arthrobacter sp. Y81 TaxID=2058897 RepID=UPI000CE3F3BB|nr:OpgC domain-containing protein [Arthrobacter sp. Y81]
MDLPRATRRAILLLLTLLLFLPAGAAQAAVTARAGIPASTVNGGEGLGASPGKPLLGGVLEWGEDDAAGFAGRLQATPAVLGHDVFFPIKGAEKGYLREFLSQSAASGAHALITVNPTVPLAAVNAGGAADFAAQLEELAEGFPGKLLIRFAPDMNSSWVSWGQQPGAYVPAYRAMAQAFDSKTNALMVWQPFQARDYPFTRNRNAPASGSPGFAALDTNADGAWNGLDAPYAPYYPGDDVVDWAGLTTHHDDTGGKAAVNTLPEDGELASLLTGTARGAASVGDGGGASDGGGDANFYESYAVQRDKPLLLQTAAYYSPSAGGPSETDIKSGWWNQVLGEAAPGKLERIAAVVWDEKTDVGDAGNTIIDWRLTRNAAVAAAAGEAVRESTLVTGPVTRTVEGLAGSSGNALAGVPAGIAAAALLLGAILLWLVPVRLRSAKRWTYSDKSSRDSRVDLMRGLAILFVVVNHVGMTSLFQLFTQEAIGFVSGAELFVLLSGLVLGMVYGPKAQDRIGEVAQKTGRRAGKLYVTALAVVVLVFVISLIPALNSEALTTFTDQGTGGAGRSGAGRTYDLYTGMQGLLQFPVSGAVIPAVLLLQFGPWQFNVMGLYVIMLLVSPLILLALARGKVLWVLAATTALYIAGTVFRFRLLPSQFEDSFPLLVWQVLFVLGLVGGYYRRTIVAWLSAHRWVVGVCAAITVAFALMSWANPYLANEFDVRLALTSDANYRAVYDQFFGRTYLEPGRLLNVITLLVTAYALLTAYWKPIERAVGWLLIPLGQATLYVFVMHVVLIAVVANIPALQQGNVWLNTAAYAAIVALLWVMVRTKFMFRIIPT